jgi:hypothetical protein
MSKRSFLMNMAGFTGSNYITAEFLESLGANVRIETKIVSADLRDFEDGCKPVIFLDYQSKAIVLNPTRAKVICVAFGTESANWVGKTIIVYHDETVYSGKKVGCVAIEAVGGQRIGAEKRPMIGPKHTGEDAPPVEEAPDGPADPDIPY